MGEQPLATTKDDKVVHVYVIRRALNWLVIGNAPVPEEAKSVRDLAHSALLLKTQSEKFFVLEYMNDSDAHLTETRPEIVRENKDRKYALIKADGVAVEQKGDEFVISTQKFYWERQLYGKALEPKYTPKELESKMRELMKDKKYHVTEHNCHRAQEVLRKELGIFE